MLFIQRDLKIIKGKTHLAVISELDNGQCRIAFTDNATNQTEIYYLDIGYLSILLTYRHIKSLMSFAIEHQQPLNIPPTENDGNKPSPDDVLDLDTSKGVSQCEGEALITSLETASQGNDELPSDDSLSAVSSSLVADASPGQSDNLIPEFVETEHVYFEPDNHISLYVPNLGRSFNPNYKPENCRFLYVLHDNSMRHSVTVRLFLGDHDIEVSQRTCSFEDIESLLLYLPNNYENLAYLLSARDPQKLWEIAEEISKRPVTDVYIPF